MVVMLRLRSCLSTIRVGGASGMLTPSCTATGAGAGAQMNNWSALHWAAHRKHQSCVKVLIEHGADPSLKNDKGAQPWPCTTGSACRCAINADG